MNLSGSFDMFVAICDDVGIIISLFIYIYLSYIHSYIMAPDCYYESNNYIIILELVVRLARDMTWVKKMSVAYLHPSDRI